MSARRRWFDPLTGAPGDGPSAQYGPRSDTPTAIGDVAAVLVRRRDWQRRLEGSQIHRVWQEVAGEAVADHVRPVRLLGGVLLLEADSGAWATQVRYLSASLIERANAELGAALVERVQIVTTRQR